MKNRNLYELKFVEKTNNECISVVRTDGNYGLQGYVYKNGRVRKGYTPYAIPKYIVKECTYMFNGA